MLYKLIQNRSGFPCDTNSLVVKSYFKWLLNKVRRTLSMMWMIQTKWWNSTLYIFVFYELCMFLNNNFQETRNIWLQIYKTIYILERFKTDFNVICINSKFSVIVFIFFEKEKGSWHLLKVSLNYFYRKLDFSHLQRKIFFLLSVNCLFFSPWLQGLIHYVNAVLFSNSC